MSRLPAVIAALSALTGCALVRGDDLASNMNRLVGHSVAEVEIILGPPANNMDAGGGKRMFQWDRHGPYQTAGVEGRVFAMATDATQARQSQCLIAVIATPAKRRTRSFAPADWVVESWSADDNCR
jgi:hypothetical protein